MTSHSTSDSKVASTTRWHALIDKAIQQLAKEAGEQHLECSLGFGGAHNIRVHLLRLQRLPNDHQLRLWVLGSYLIGKQEHECASYKAIPHIFPSMAETKSEPDPASDSVRTLIGEAFQSALKELRQICSVCQRQSRHVRSQVDDGPGERKEQRQAEGCVCKSCDLSAVLIKFVSTEQKDVSFGVYAQKECAVCLEEFTPIAHIGQNDGCGHVFHYHCLCSLTKPKCPLCKEHIERIKRMSDCEWMPFQCDEDEEMS